MVDIWKYLDYFEGHGALTGLAIHEEIILVLVLLTGMTILLIKLAGGSGEQNDVYAAVILSESQKKLIDRLVLPERCVGRRHSHRGSTDEELEKEAAEEGKSRITRSNSSRWNQAKHTLRNTIHTIRSFVSRDELQFHPEKFDVMEGRTPLLVFFNRKSGGQNGDFILTQFSAFFPSYQIWEIGSNGGPEKGLEFFRDVPNFRVLVAGGDGSVSWVLQTIDRLKMAYEPPVAVLPVGTGNDLSRVLGWGGGLSGGLGNALVQQLLELVHGDIDNLDRWSVECVMPNGRKNSKKGGKDNSNKRKENKTTSLVLNNYLGIGVDAQISLNFHEGREASPHLFTSRFINKYIWYASSGGKEILLQRFADFSNKVTLECDGKIVPLPRGAEGIILLNISSYGGGVNLWGHDTAESVIEEDDEEATEGQEEESKNRPSSPRSESSSTLRSRKKKQQVIPPSSPSHGASQSTFRRASMNDGWLEVVSVASSFQLGAAQVGLARPQRLCQCRRVKLTINMPLPLQVDGEPMKLKTNTVINISFLNQKAMLSRRFGTRVLEISESARIVDQVLHWAKNQNVLNEEQRQILQKEFQKQINKRKRQNSIESIF